MRLFLILICICCFSCKIEKKHKNVAQADQLKKKGRCMILLLYEIQLAIRFFYNRLGITDSKIKCNGKQL
jgi:hypothetical protein